MKRKAGGCRNVCGGPWRFLCGYDRSARFGFKENLHNLFAECDGWLLTFLSDVANMWA